MKELIPKDKLGVFVDNKDTARVDSIFLERSEKMPNKFQAIREHHGFTQAEVAEATDVSPKFISAIENGRKNPSWTYAIQLADFYNVSLDDFRETNNEKSERRCE